MHTPFLNKTFFAAEAMDGSPTYIIPRDPRTARTIFLTSLPCVLQGFVDETEWMRCIGGLNEIMLRKEAPSVLNAIKHILLIPGILDARGYEREVREHLRAMNARLSEKGVVIKDPSASGFTELEFAMM